MMKWILVAFYLGNAYGLDTGLTGTDCTTAAISITRKATVELEPGLTAPVSQVQIACQLDNEKPGLTARLHSFGHGPRMARHRPRLIARH